MSENSFAIRMIDVDNFKAVGMINRKYADFTEKHLFPFVLTIELSLVNTDGGYPTSEESERLEEIELNLRNIVKQTQSEVHYIGRVNREGAQDIFYYIATDELDGEAIGMYCDTIEADRGIDIQIFDDANWDSVSGLLD
ncbi:MAG: DUF695 domain-containing protein [Flavobacterium sp.]